MGKYFVLQDLHLDKFMVCTLFSWNTLCSAGCRYFSKRGWIPVEKKSPPLFLDLLKWLEREERLETKLSLKQLRESKQQKNVLRQQIHFLFSLQDRDTFQYLSEDGQYLQGPHLKR